MSGLPSQGWRIPLSLWWRASLFLAIGLLIALGLLGVIWLLAQPLALLLAAIVLAEALEPAVARVAPRLTRPGAVVLIYLLVVFALGALGWFVVAQLTGQVDEALANAPALIDRAQELVDRWSARLGLGIRGMIENWVSGGAALLAEVPAAAVSGALYTILVLVMSAYWSIALPAIRGITIESAMIAGLSPQAANFASSRSMLSCRSNSARLNWCTVPMTRTVRSASVAGSSASPRRASIGEALTTSSSWLESRS